MLASFSVIPIGAGDELKSLVAEALSIVDKAGLPYSLGAMQTTVEGDQQEVMDLIMECHRRVLAVCPRVLTHIAIDERTGYSGRLHGKIRDVEEVLGKELDHE